MTVREFDLMLEGHLPELAEKVKQARYDDRDPDSDGLALPDRWDTYSVSGTALIDVFPDFLDRMAVTPNEDAVNRFIAFLREWQSRDPGRVLGDVVPLWLRGHVQDSETLMRLFPPDLREGYAE